MRYASSLTVVPLAGHVVPDLPASAGRIEMALKI
jgi:hypothetical protein